MLALEIEEQPWILCQRCLWWSHFCLLILRRLIDIFPQWLQGKCHWRSPHGSAEGGPRSSGDHHAAAGTVGLCRRKAVTCCREPGDAAVSGQWRRWQSQRGVENIWSWRNKSEILSVSFKIFLSYDKPGGCVDTNSLATMCCYTDTAEIGTNNNHNIIWTQTDPNRHARNQIIITFFNFFCHFYLQDYICMTTCNKISIKNIEKMNFQF